MWKEDLWVKTKKTIGWVKEKIIINYKADKMVKIKTKINKDEFYITQEQKLLKMRSKDSIKIKKERKDK